MLKSLEVYIKLNSKTIKHYEDLGYEIPRYLALDNKLKVRRGSILKVKVEDLQKNSTVDVECLCDYCLEKGIETIIIKAFSRFTECNTNGIIHKDCCPDCNTLKVQESNALIYGFNNVRQVPEIANKAKETLIKNIGVDNPFKSKVIQAKIRKNNIIKFGHESYFSTKEFKILFSGRMSSNWKGGVTNLRKYLRGKVNIWVNDSLNEYGNKCIFTGDIIGIAVHHINKNFSDLLAETLYNLHLEIKEIISEYSEIELELLSNEIVRLHYQYGYGVPLKKELHIDFHNKYGYKNNNENQFQDFIKFYNEGVA